MADPEIWKGEGAEDNVSTLLMLSCISNAHNELYAFYTGKGDLLKKCRGSKGRPHPLSTPLNPPLVTVIFLCFRIRRHPL